MNEPPLNIPRHVGYILDGNRRWAKRHGLPAYEGHLAGYEAVKEVIFSSINEGIQYVTIYLFSTENWKRSEGEVSKIMSLAMRAFKADLNEFVKRGIRIKILGVEEWLSEKVIAAGREAEEATKNLKQGTLCICFNYGGYREIVDAARKLIEEGVPAASVTEETFAEHLYAPEVPAMDVVVRTSGEQRMSNFMLWRAAYSEFIFLQKYWPDMRATDVHDIIKEYNNRQRRFGN